MGYRNQIPAKLVSLIYADDIILLADKCKKMQGMLNICINEMKKLNMEMSKIMIINDKETDYNGTILCKGQALEEVTTFVYLESVITNDEKIELARANRAG